MSGTLWSVALGGGLTLLGTSLVELLKSRSSSKQRREDRQNTAREVMRTAIHELQTAAANYQATLRRYERALQEEQPITPQLDDELGERRAAFQLLVYRVPASPRDAMLAWEQAAVNWSQQEASAAIETQRWEDAMRACGFAIRASLTETPT